MTYVKVTPAGDQYGAIVWKGAGTPQKLWFSDPVEALECAVLYLRKGYQARLTDGAVEWFGDNDRENETTDAKRTA